MLVHVEPQSGSEAAIGRPEGAAFARGRELSAILRREIQGEVRFDDGSRALYSTDGSNYRQVPIGVVLPRNKDDVVRTVAACRAFGAPLLSRGGGTSLAGQCCNTAVVMDMSKYMHRVLAIDRGRGVGIVEPGCVLDDLRAQANRVGLTFGPDPATHTHCTLGGMVGNNSCGVHAQMAGRTADNIEELEILTYDGVRMKVGRTSEAELDRNAGEQGRRGEIYRALRKLRDRYAGLIRERFPRIPRRISGYNLDELLPENGFHVARALVGTESTCVTILEITGKLVHNPPGRALVVLGYPDVFRAADHIPQVVAHGPIGCEGIDDRLLGYYKMKGVHLKELALMPEGAGWLIVEFGGETRAEAEDRARSLMEDLKRAPDAPEMKLYDDPAHEKTIWEVREGGLGATAFVPGQRPTWPGWEDSAVGPEKLGGYLRELRALFDKYDYDPSLYGHFGQGCVHCRVPFDLFTAQGIAKWRGFMDEATSLVVKYGGSLSGEHGDGQARAEFLGKMFGAELLRAFREFKSIWDPDGKMNPGKVVDPYPIDTNLRLGVAYNPPAARTHFHYPDDNFSFSRATLRCVGVGECRRESGKTMCPSYRVTREEMHSTRGRARLLFEMLEGRPLEEGWRDPHVREALDLCLSCKGCKGDCPVSVDMATYKAEFLSHYYAGRLRPRSAYASGLIAVWARAASFAPEVANLLTQTPGLSALAKFAAGYSQKRTIPKFAPETFRAWFRRHQPAESAAREVVLWPDTFNNYFTPEVAVDAVRVLESAGARVTIPPAVLCCGRPLYDYGMLDTARAWLLRILDVLRPAIRAGTPVIGLEPSCVSVFRDEMTNLLHGNEQAERLREQTFTLSEYLRKHAPGYAAGKIEGRAVVHGHCHQKSVLGFEDERALIAGAGLEAEILDAGCCGMAGAFGYESEHYETGLKCGELVLLPAVRKAPGDTLLVADGFSCREMIIQETGRQPLHIAQVLARGLGGRDATEPLRRHSAAGRAAVAIATVAAGVLAGLIIGRSQPGGRKTWQRRRKSS